MVNPTLIRPLFEKIIFWLLRPLDKKPRDLLSLGWCVHGSTGWMRVSLTALEDFLASGRNSGVAPAYHHSLRFGWYKLAFEDRDISSSLVKITVMTAVLRLTPSVTSFILYRPISMAPQRIIIPSTKTPNAPFESAERSHITNCVRD